jgi:hypothetical protein
VYFVDFAVKHFVSANSVLRWHFHRRRVFAFRMHPAYYRRGSVSYEEKQIAIWQDRKSGYAYDGECRFATRWRFKGTREQSLAEGRCARNTQATAENPVYPA